MHAPQTSPLWQGVGGVSSACEVGVEGGYRLQARLLGGEVKQILLFINCQRCVSKSEELIRPSNLDVSPHLWKRIVWRRVVWEKYTIEGPKSLIPQRICTHACTHRCAHVQNRTHTHTHARRHARIKLKKSQTNGNENFSKLQKSKYSQSENNYRHAQNQIFHKTLLPTLLQTIKRHVSLLGQIRQMALMARRLIVPPHNLQSVWPTRYVYSSGWFPRSISKIHCNSYVV